MAEPPSDPLAPLHRYVAATTLAHEYTFDLYRELAARGADDEATRRLVDESAAIVLERLPAEVDDLVTLERLWREQELLDPSAARATLTRIQAGLKAIEPRLVQLRARQDAIAGELRQRLE